MPASEIEDRRSPPGACAVFMPFGFGAGTFGRDGLADGKPAGKAGIGADADPLVERILADSKAEADRLLASGWTKRDFADALLDFLGEPPRTGPA